MTLKKVRWIENKDPAFDAGKAERGSFVKRRAHLSSLEFFRAIASFFAPR
jgi:hypothetical protein